MTTAKRKREQKKQKMSLDRVIALLSGVMAVVGWAILIYATIHEPPIGPQPPVIQDGIRISRPVVSVGEMVPVRVIVKDPDLPDDEISYHWAAYRGKIGEQLDPFQGPEVIYVAPALPGIDVISVMVYDRKGETDKDFCIVTIKEAERLSSPP